MFKAINVILQQQTLADNKDNSELQKWAVIFRLWIPSHVGIKGNEKADEIAKLGVK
jgi:ribonuclease HI